MIRVREFTMCEIEHFVDPNNKSHPKFEQVKDYNLMLFSACNQMDGAPAQIVPIGEAVAKVRFNFNSKKIMCIFVVKVIANIFFNCIFGNNIRGKGHRTHFFKLSFQKLVANETLGYYMVRVHKYLIRVGIDIERLRFRQHLSNEMAHYARVCSFIYIFSEYACISCGLMRHVYSILFALWCLLTIIAACSE